MSTRRIAFLLLLTVLYAPAACAAAPPPRAAGLKESREPGGGMLGREYPRFAGELGPLPGHVIGLLVPADSRWGRSLEWIGEAVAAVPQAYAFPADAKRGYELYAAGLAPRVLLRNGSPVLPDKAEAQLAEVEFGEGFGISIATTFNAEATRIRVLDGQPGYPASTVQLLDAARAEFNRFTQAEARNVKRILAEEKARFRRVAGAPSPDRITNVLYPYWDEARKTLVVLFHQRVMRMVEGSLPCEIVYGGMPPQPSSRPFRYGYGVELGEKLELDAGGTVTAMTAFTPAGIEIPPDVDLSRRKSAFEPCPGSPGLNMEPRPLGMAPGLTSVPQPESRCANGIRDPGGAEECDGADLGGQTCERLGYLGGRLQCSRSCALDPGDCDPTTGPPARVVRRALEGTWGALARLDDGRLAAVGERGRSLVVRYFQGGSLEPAGAKTEWSLPGEPGQSSLGEPMAAAFGSSLVVAVARSGAPQQTLLLRVSPSGAITGPGATIPGRATFLVPRGARALLGLISARSDFQLETVVVDAQGQPAGAPRPAVVAQGGTGYARGAAVATPYGWLVSMGTNGQYGAAATYARLGADGALLGTGEVKLQTGQVTVARGTSSSFIVQTHPGGVIATEVDDAGAPSPPRLMGRGFFPWIVAATAGEKRLTAWASESTGRVQQLELDLGTSEISSRPLLSVPLYIPVSTVLGGGTFLHLFQAAPVRGRPIDPALWLYAGPAP